MSLVERQTLPITTNLGHVDRAMAFYEENDIYFALGRTTPWEETETTNPNFVPPTPDPTATSLDELICMKKVSQKLLVMPADDGTIEYNKIKWKILSKEEAMQNQARWVYIKAELYYDEIDITSYRQLGIYTRVTKRSDVANTKTLLLPEEIKDPGLLIMLNNRHVVTRQPDTRDNYAMVIEF
jgi:hypothetical protein